MLIEMAIKGLMIDQVTSTPIIVRLGRDFMGRGYAGLCDFDRL